MRIRHLAPLFAAVSMLLAPAAQAQIFGQGPWTGVYVGLHGGYNWNNDSNNAITGGAIGVQGGYNLQLGSALIGIEADYSRSWAGETNTVANAQLTTTAENMWSVRGRLGWILLQNFMIYGTAGYGGFDINVKGIYSSAFGPLAFQGSANFNGIVYGGGAELLLTRSIMLRAEALMYQGDGTSGATGISTEMGIVRAAISYKF